MNALFMGAREKIQREKILQRSIFLQTKNKIFGVNGTQNSKWDLELDKKNYPFSIPFTLAYTKVNGTQKGSKWD